MPKQLGIDDIVAHVEATEGWRMVGTCIRRDLAGQPGCACPVSSLGGMAVSQYPRVAKSHGIDLRVSRIVAYAADTPARFLTPWSNNVVSVDELHNLRRRLLAAAKLTEVEDAND